MMLLSLGCGDRKETWKGDGLDYKDFGQKYIFNLEDIKPFPIEDNCYDICEMMHVFEHISNPTACINILNEVWRVLKPGGVFKGEVPHYLSPNYTRDFYHVRPFSQHSFDAYLEGSKIYFNDYGVKCTFRPIGQGVYLNGNQDVCWTLEVVK